MTYISLNNGLKMPVLGLGTDFQVGRACINLVYEALKLGYRLFDTAQMYKNEFEVGQGIKRAIDDGIVKREEIFLQSKLLAMDYESTKLGIDERLSILGLEYLDMLLIHYPNPYEKAMWKALEEGYKEGKLKAIGLSNFIANYESFVRGCEIKPMLNQLEVHVFHQRKALYPLMQKDKIVLQAWSPFVVGKNNFFNNEILAKIGAKYNKSIAQVALRWMIEQEISTIPRTNKSEKLKQNLDIFDFKLDEEDKEQISSLDTNRTYFGWYE
ncbi:2,5-diketo-D-gluconic acid reductase [Campylobacter sp. MIT 99-7217]|uniref:aldo/keto reductase n=1 Tax=Campylobacter sp. MIT 99-7217 TaxID=535091 RepID=UPI00115A3A8F|nr:aldo/keto reductase [Campylobacter sp. MIT 99-7217]TQR30352.1 2,5-diketo-D-gluconic acid reductase [Campylobacter sp. MIT 99-7217]